MKTVIKIGTIILLFLGMMSCNKAKRETEKRVTKFMGDTITLPEKSNVLYKDSLYQKNFPFNQDLKLKITTLLWGDCKSCIAKLKKWDTLFNLIQSKQDIEILFYLYTSDFSHFKKRIYNHNIHQYPLILDKEFEYIDNNGLPFKKKVYQTFLLDSNNRVILVGNPIYNKKLIKLYKKEINKRLD
jgi:hypothetical protein